MIIIKYPKDKVGYRKSIREFNTEGNIITHYSIQKNYGYTSKAKATYQYNERGQLVSIYELGKNRKGEILFKDTITYNYRNDTLVNKINIHYAYNIYHSKKFIRDSKSQEITIYNYSDGEISETCYDYNVYIDSGSTYWKNKLKYKFDKDSFLIKIEKETKPSDSSTIEYHYNKSDNNYKVLANNKFSVYSKGNSTIESRFETIECSCIKNWKPTVCLLSSQSYNGKQLIKYNEINMPKIISYHSRNKIFLKREKWSYKYY